MGLRCFLPKPTKKFSLQNGVKTAHGLVLVALFFFFFFFFFNILTRQASYMSNAHTYIYIYISFAFFCIFFFFLFLFLLFRCDFFFLDMIFLKKNLGDWFFFFLVVYPFFVFNWTSFFNKGICINLYKLTFSIILLFHSQLNKKKGN